MDKRQMIGCRIAREFKDGDYVNLGIGLPTMAVDYIPEGIHVVFQSENGMLGVGPSPAEGTEDPDMINAGGGFITALTVHSALLSFAVDTSMLQYWVRCRWINRETWQTG